MAIKYYKPTTNGRRNMSTIDYSILTTDKPQKSLSKSIHHSGGRNNQGRITTRHKGGKHKNKYRIIDFKRNKDNIIGRIASIEYDPNRNCFISLVNYLDGEKRYILSPLNIKLKDEIISGDVCEFKIGNAMEIRNIPEGTVIHNVEMKPGKGGQIARSAGARVQLLGPADELKKYFILRLTSGEVRKILGTCRATIGEIGNQDYNLVNIGKAGRNRWRGIRPTVRGSVMNPNDHPHGGGEGKSPIGRKTPYTPWGKKALGVKTRNKKKASSKMIIRHKKK